jgi:hypothetical protein
MAPAENNTSQKPFSVVVAHDFRRENILAWSIIAAAQ